MEKELYHRNRGARTTRRVGGREHVANYTTGIGVLGQLRYNRLCDSRRIIPQE